MIHTGQIELMLENNKPLAMFYAFAEELPDEALIPETAFSQHVKEGRFVREEITVTDSHPQTGLPCYIKYVFFAKAGEQWRIPAMTLVVRTHHGMARTEEGVERIQHALLGYTEDETDAYRKRHFSHRRRPAPFRAAANQSQWFSRGSVGIRRVGSARVDIMLERVEKFLFLSYRLQFVSIGAAFGSVMGAALWLICGPGFTPRLNPADVITFSVAYFAVAGVIVGPFLGDLVDPSTGGLLGLLAIDNYTRPHLTPERTFRPLWIGLSFLLWLMAFWLIYMRR